MKAVVEIRNSIPGVMAVGSRSQPWRSPCRFLIIWNRPDPVLLAAIPGGDATVDQVVVEVVRSKSEGLVDRPFLLAAAVQDVVAGDDVLLPFRAAGADDSRSATGSMFAAGPGCGLVGLAIFQYREIWIRDQIGFGSGRQNCAKVGIQSEQHGQTSGGTLEEGRTSSSKMGQLPKRRPGSFRWQTPPILDRIRIPMSLGADGWGSTLEIC